MWYASTEPHRFLQTAAVIGSKIRMEARLAQPALSYLWDHCIAGNLLGSAMLSPGPRHAARTCNSMLVFS